MERSGMESSTGAVKELEFGVRLDLYIIRTRIASNYHLSTAEYEKEKKRCL